MEISVIELVVMFLLGAVPVYLGLHHIFVPKVGKYRDLGLFEGDATDAGASTDPVERTLSRIYGIMLVLAGSFFLILWFFAFMTFLGY